MNRLTPRSTAPRLAFVLLAAVPLFTLVVFFRGNGSKAAASASAAVASRAAGASVVTHRPSTSARPARAGHPARGAPPTANEFSGVFVEVTNQYAKEHGDPARLANADCVAAAPGRYMCSYSVEKPGAANGCHLMQARWTPGRASSFTVTLAGRTRKCGSVREAIRSLP